MSEHTLFHGNHILYEWSEDLDGEVRERKMWEGKGEIFFFILQFSQEKKQAEEQKKKTLKEAGIEDNSILRIEDDAQGLSVDLVVRHVVGLQNKMGEEGEELDQTPFELLRSGGLKMRDAHDVGMASSSEGGGGGDDDEDDIVIVETAEKGEKGATEPRKKRKLQKEDDDGVVVL